MISMMLRIPHGLGATWRGKLWSFILIEDSGSYAISNIDLTSQEIYFTKYDVSFWLEQKIFLSYQTEYPESSEILQEILGEAITVMN